MQQAGRNGVARVRSGGEGTTMLRAFHSLPYLLAFALHMVAVLWLVGVLGGAVGERTLMAAVLLLAALLLLFVAPSSPRGGRHRRRNRRQNDESREPLRLHAQRLGHTPPGPGGVVHAAADDCVVVARAAAVVSNPPEADATAVSYGERWNEVRGEPWPPLDEDEARRRHEAGEPYVAYVHDVDGRPGAVVELGLRCARVGVSFLDENGHRATYYIFKPDRAGGLRLDEFGGRRVGRDGQITLAERRRFLPGGLVSATRRNLLSGEHKRWEDRLDDLSKLSEPMPAFGDYESITRYER